MLTMVMTASHVSHRLTTSPGVKVGGPYQPPLWTSQDVCTGKEGYSVHFFGFVSKKVKCMPDHEATQQVSHQKNARHQVLYVGLLSDLSKCNDFCLVLILNTEKVVQELSLL